MNYIKVEGFTKKIKKSVILDNINITLEQANIYGFVGRNGSGKTMLFRAISGLIRATSGRVIINGKVIGKDIDFPESCGIVLENSGFWDYQTGFECLKNIASIKNIISDETIKMWMIKLGLNANDKRTFNKYSLGMKQKLALTQAFMESPDIIILDEPTNALDEESVSTLHNIIIEESKRGAIILIASHNKTDIELICNKIYKVDQGKVKDV